MNPSTAALPDQRPTSMRQGQRPHGYAQLARRAAPLLNQQCWCWGCDVRRPEGNVLLAHGFSRQRVPAGNLGSSAYTLYVDGAAVVLWGFGVFWSEPALGGVFVARQGFVPQLLDDPTPPSDVWDMGHLNTAMPNSAQAWTTACALLSRALHWIARYEAWVAQACGPHYRVTCVDAWRKRTVAACDMPARWRMVADSCHQLSCTSRGDDGRTG